MGDYLSVRYLSLLALLYAYTQIGFHCILDIEILFQNLSLHRFLISSAPQLLCSLLSNVFVLLSLSMIKIPCKYTALSVKEHPSGEESPNTIWFIIVIKIQGLIQTLRRGHLELRQGR